jgi:Na+-translocating ferredoxin:NAD+ oxidoreductase subunit E
MNSHFREITRKGLWQNNPALVQLLGLCPLLAVSNSVVNALGLGLATILVLCGSNLTVSLLRDQVIPAIRLPAFVMIIAAFTTCAELLMQAYAYTLYLTLGIFIPLIVTNCVILGRAEGFASRNPPLPALYDGLMMGAGFTAVLLVLGALREVLGTGSLFANMELLLPFAASWEIQWYETSTPFLLAILPPGAFLFLGFLIALKNVIDKRLARLKTAPEAHVSGSKRVRVTGQV